MARLEPESVQEEEDASTDEERAVQFTDLPSEDEVQISEAERLTPAVLHGTDWTTETVISQLKRGNIILNPSFQRRDAWSRKQKSRFIESLILGLPIPQIVLAETRESRGKFDLAPLADSDRNVRIAAVLNEEGRTMSRKQRHTPEQVIGKLREAEVKLAKGTEMPTSSPDGLSMTENTYYRWRRVRRHAGRPGEGDQGAVEKENGRLMAAGRRRAGLGGLAGGSPRVLPQPLEAARGGLEGLVRARPGPHSLAQRSARSSDSPLDAGSAAAVPDDEPRAGRLGVELAPSMAAVATEGLEVAAAGERLPGQP